MRGVLEAIFQRRAIKVFAPGEIPREVRELILDAARMAPSSFNMQPYRFYWVESPVRKAQVAELCMGQKPASTAAALVVAVADIGSWEATTESHLDWVRQAGFSAEKIAEQEKRSKLAKWFFIQGWFGVIGFAKWVVLRTLNLWKTIGMAPVSRRGLFHWAVKSTALACQNLMIAAEALGMNTCPMEGFDGRRLAKFLGLSPGTHEIVMVVAIGKRAAGHLDAPQWRRPLESTVTIL